MAKNMIRIFDCETQETIDREMTPEEWANCQSVEAQSKIKENALEQEKANRISALSKLGALGLTPEEINAIS